MVANEYKIMCDCVERGTDRGFERAHKHDDKPSEEHIKQCISDAIMLEICENFVFKDIHEDNV